MILQSPKYVAETILLERKRCVKYFSDIFATLQKMLKWSLRGIISLLRYCKLTWGKCLFKRFFVIVRARSKYVK